MRKQFSDKVERGRERRGHFGSRPGDPFGAFAIFGPCGAELTVIASDGHGVLEAEGWEHVSVSTERRPPNWTEMSFIKDLFFEDNECVVEFHPPRQVYVNVHPHCLHLWKPPYDVKLPPHMLVG
jgi:hypothetical protein